MNTLGYFLRLTSFGESHGPGIGAVLDGFPAGFDFPFEAVKHALYKRRPGQNNLVSPRNEKDEFQVLSGVFEGKTTGAPITFFIPNEDAKPKDYDQLKEVYRPNHADFTYQSKYGIRDYRGGGRSSARITAGWVAAGALAQDFLQKQGVQIIAFVSRIGPYQMADFPNYISEVEIEQNELRCPDKELYLKMKEAIIAAKAEGDSLGGIISCRISGVPIGLGEPLFGKLHAQLGQAMLSINAVKGFEFGGGFQSSALKGSEFNDAFIKAENNTITTATNHSGGIQGGISNGQNIDFRVAFHPVATLSKAQNTVNSSGEEVELSVAGRHDVCVVPRAVPIVNALASLVILDAYLGNKVSRLPL